MAVANATHNPLAIWIYRQINEVRQHTQWSRVKDKVLTPARIASYNRQHRALFESIAGRHAESAIELINRHLAEAKSDLIGVQSK
jgi:DNA-binding FadR family transcriptional regulator